MSFTDIANRALFHLGVSKQLSANTLSTSSRPDAAVLYSLQSTALKKTLIAADWDFATWIADLDLAETDPNDGIEWPYSYYLPDGTGVPPECVKPRRIVNGDRNLTPFSQIPFRIMANVTQRFAIDTDGLANDEDNVVITTTAAHGLAAGDTFYIEGTNLGTLNRRRVTATSVTTLTITIDDNDGELDDFTSPVSGTVSWPSTLLYTDEEDAQLEYTGLVTDTDLFPEEFSEAMACMWAYLAAPAITGGDPHGLGMKAFQLFEREISKATARDGNKRQWDVPPESEFTAGR